MCFSFYITFPFKSTFGRDGCMPATTTDRTWKGTWLTSGVGTPVYNFRVKKNSNTGSTRVFHHRLECPFYIRCPKGKRLYTQWSYWRSEVSSLEKSALWRVSLNQPPCCLLLIERYLLFWKTNRTFGASWKTHMFCRKKKCYWNCVFHTSNP